MESHDIVLAGLFHSFVVHTCVISLIVCVCSFLFVNKQYLMVPKCLRSEVSWVRSVLTPPSQANV